MSHLTRIFISLFFINSYSVTAQKTPKPLPIYYFLTKDSLVGVKDAHGKIIINPRMIANWGIEFNRPIKDEWIYLRKLETEPEEAHSWESVYDRNGKFLFATFSFDNDGSDGFHEGLSRIVKNGKVGFINTEGVVVIPPKYDFAEMFIYGISAYCNGCTWKRDGELEYISGGNWGYINSFGDSLAIFSKRMSMKDQIIDSGKYIRYQFKYTEKETAMVNFLYRFPEISKAYFVNYMSPLDSVERQLTYEITQRPSHFMPYYQISSFEYSKNYGYTAGELQFYVSPSGMNYFHSDYDGKMIPFNKWRKENIRDAKKYVMQHPEMPYKF